MQVEDGFVLGKVIDPEMGHSNFVVKRGRAPICVPREYFRLQEVSWKEEHPWSLSFRIMSDTCSWHRHTLMRCSHLWRGLLCRGIMWICGIVLLFRSLAFTCFSFENMEACILEMVIRDLQVFKEIPSVHHVAVKRLWRVLQNAKICG